MRQIENMFSKSCEYGLKAVIYIASQSLEGKRIKIDDIAEKAGSPRAFTAKILGTLTKFNIINSLKGPYGGFDIEIKRMKEIKISEIVFAIDGDSIYNGCALGLTECNAQEPCPMHENFVQIREELKKMLETTTIFELATKFNSGESILVRKDRIAS